MKTYAHSIATLAVQGQPFKFLAPMMAAVIVGPLRYALLMLILWGGSVLAGCKFIKVKMDGASDNHLAGTEPSSGLI